MNEHFGQNRDVHSKIVTCAFLVCFQSNSDSFGRLRKGTMRHGCLAYLFIYLFHFHVYNNPALEAKQSLLEALRHIKFILSTAVRGDSLPASEY